jgi:hypothetical protein
MKNIYKDNNKLTFVLTFPFKRKKMRTKQNVLQFQ